MLKRRVVFLGVAGVVALGGAGCTRGGETTAKAVAEIEERTYAVQLAPTALRIDFLAAELTGLQVVERVRRGSGEVVDKPMLRGTLRVKNTSDDRAVRIVSGALEYLGADGRPIALPADRGGSTFTFYAYSGGDRIDPGKELSQSIDVAFPSAAVNGASLAEVRLGLTYLPTPYRRETATVPASLVAKGS